MSREVLAIKAMRHSIWTPEVAEALAKLANRELFTGDDDLVFVGEAGSYLDGSALLRRYKQALQRAALRSLRFHDLRHTLARA
jgi:integrase